MADTRLDALLDPAFVDDLHSLPLDQIRARRAQCSEVEVWLSYFRRLVQGRLDIVLSEARRRESGGEAADVAALVARLPEILSEHLRAPGNGHLPTLMALADVGVAMTSPAESDLSQVDRLDSIVDADRLVALPELADDELRDTVAALSALEHETSASRRGVHEVMDRLQGELVRRYKSGEATVDGLLP